MTDQRIRILLIIFSFDIEAVGGGISRFAVSLSQVLDPSKFQVCLCGLWNRGTQVEKQRIRSLNAAGIEAFTCSPWNEAHPYQAFLNAYQNLRNYQKSYPIDIVHSHSLFGDIAALWLNFEGKAPIILRTLHNELRTEWSRRPLRRILLTNLLYPLAFDVEIGVSQFIRENLNQRWLAKWLGRDALTIHNALDSKRFSNRTDHSSAIKQELGIPENAYIVGSVGRLTQQKGYDILLDASAMAIKTIPNLFIVIVGDGEDSEILKQQAVRLGIEKQVLFTGPRSDVDTLLSIFDLFACSSRWEGLSTVVMEAMAAGVPILATDIPGNRELLHPGKSAWFVTPENANSLAEGMVNAYQNQDISKEYVQNAMAGVRSFDIEEIAKIHSRLYLFIYQNQQNSTWMNHRKIDKQLHDNVGLS
jgi:glycosyltransferase involved in cell wall biosynthesis